MAGEWFASWFDSPYYPILYRHRDHREAEAFIRTLLDALGPAPEARFLDLACGRGRHARFVHREGYRVTGLDLSPDSIAEARAEAGDGLDFHVHDMREPFPGAYDYILNMFTSFGYFSDPADNVRVLRNVREALRPGGTFVLDYMNVPHVVAGLVPEETKRVDGIVFGIRRALRDGFIVKDIQVRDGGATRAFQERVQALRRADFERMFREAGLDVLDVWGDYAGKKWEEKTSPRLIFFCR